MVRILALLVAISYPMTDEAMAGKGGGRRKACPTLLTLHTLAPFATVTLDMVQKLLLVFRNEAAWHATETLSVLLLSRSSSPVSNKAEMIRVIIFFWSRRGEGSILLGGAISWVSEA